MPAPLSRKITLNDLRAARSPGAARIPMLTCYDFSTARLMQQAGVPALLVGDSAANVILGHDTTLPVPLGFLIELTAAVRRGAPLAFLVGDMPFGSYGGSLDSGVRNVCKMVKRTGCDSVKLELAAGHVNLIRALADVGVAVMAHIGLRPQSVGLMGGYKFQGRSADDARAVVALAETLTRAGAAALLLEAVPPEVSAAVVAAVGVPVIGCGAGPACHGSVIVTHDALGFNARPPRFAPRLDDLASAATNAYAEYARRVSAGEYPAAEHNYAMSPEERRRFEEVVSF